MLAGNAITEDPNRLGRELDDAPARSTDHVIVWVFSQGVFVVRMLDIKPRLPQDARIDEQGKRAIDRGLTHLLPALSKEIKHLLGLKVVAQLQDGVENALSRGGELDALKPQVAPKSRAHVEFVRIPLPLVLFQKGIPRGNW